MEIIGLLRISLTKGGEMSRQVLVIGNHRTGSSCVAGLLHKMGVNMGDTMLGAHPSNPLGHFEDREFLLLNDSLVAPWHNPTILTSDEELAVPRMRYERLINARDFKRPIWGIKDPRLCITASYFIDLLFDPVIINTCRNRDSVIKSLMKRDGWSEEKASDIHDIYSREEDLTVGDARDALGIPVLTVFFEDLLDSPDVWIEEMFRFVFPKAPAYLRDETVGTLVDHVRPDLVSFKDG